MRCQFLASCFLLFSLSTKGAVSSEGSKIIWGALDHDINLVIPDFKVTADIDEIRWDKRGSLIAEFKRRDMKPHSMSIRFEISANGTLTIKQLKEEDNDIYNVMMYGTDGKNKLHKTFDLRILEMVSKPMISWVCSNETLTCNVMNGTDLELELYQGRRHLGSHRQKVVSHKWTNLKAPFKCKARNKVSEEFITEYVSCSEKGLHLYLIVGASAGGFLLVVLGALLVICVCKRKKQNRRRKDDEELEIRAPRMSTVERGPKPHSTSATASQNPVASQAPPPPVHHLQTPGHRPLPPSHRTREQQQRKRPPPSGTQVYQQKGPPLPRPRVQPRLPCEGGEDASLPPSN